MKKRIKIFIILILKEFIFMKDYLLVALDGTYYHSSKKISCNCCQTKTDVRRTTKISR